MDILLTNDDGIRSPGIKTLWRALCSLGHNVQVVAPVEQQSGVSQCLTIFEPLRAQTFQEEDYHGTAVCGTPADCVKLGLGALATGKPDLVVSGINLGANVGSDLFYSGTVAAAAEACQAMIPAMALSLNDHNARDFTAQAQHAARLIAQIPWQDFPQGRMLNVNYPSVPLAQSKGLKVCPHSKAAWENVYQECRDPRGVPYWWLVGDMKEEDILSNTDRALLRSGYITVTPLHFDFTDRKSLEVLEKMNLA